ncbi:MAG TPA: PTS sugar transporter subunit IIA [Candidatus Cloacimonadota bacterium]|nr:PTS sugar transporter subunit IIA [Candidatus Cloacimonadota bacterium]HOD53371.1 PTS sugar transporter subunit IIA [Candidatus Cloacimonadota bacterium]HPM01225.1 PTS sugar transporter subunit IIA [Candidatus Cloacimonadota bacterium]
MNNTKLLSVAEAAKYLKVAESVVIEMINSGTFKEQKTGKSVKVDKIEIDEWLTNLNENEEAYLAMKRTICRFQDYFKIENIFLDFEADNKYEAIAVMSRKARDLKLVRDHRWLYEVVVAREELVSTAVGEGVAMLHPRHMHPTKIKTPSILFGRSVQGVEFDAPDNQPVSIFFMLLLHNDMQHLFSLSFLSKFLKTGDNLQTLLNANTPEDIMKCFEAYDANQPIKK